MSLSKKRLDNAKLYLILDAQVLDYSKLLGVLKESVRFGIDIVQLRDKFGTAKEVLSFCRHALKITKHQIPLIVNDRIDLALLSKADGVHLGQDDISISDAKRLMHSTAIIGCSCQNLSQALQAQKDGAHYIGFGSVFRTKTKPERNPMNLKLLRKVLSHIDIPVFPIGGINVDNVDLVKDCGASRVAVCRDILLARHPGQIINEFRKALS